MASPERDAVCEHCQRWRGVDQPQMVRRGRFAWTEYVDRAEETDKVPFTTMLAA